HRLAISRAKLRRLTHYLAFDVFAKPIGGAITISPIEWPAPSSEDTELGVFMELEVSHGETKARWLGTGRSEELTGRRQRT
ncbi:MAG: hypothetical protein WA446_19250, partial [Steroidobacteraceae bacterium]